MPVVFAPPDPVGVGIQSGYGATQQWDKTFPILASYYSDQNRQAMAQQEMAMRAAASRGGGGGGGSDLDNEWRMEMADRQNASSERQTLARLERDAESQRYDAAIKDRMMGHQDELRMQQMQAGLAQLEQDVRNGYLSKEEAADAAYTLRTGVDRVRQRLEAQHAEQYKALSKKQLETMGMQQSVMKANMEIQAKSGRELAQLDPRAQLLEEDRLRPKYQAMAAVIGAEAAQREMEKEVRDNVIRKGEYRPFIGISSHGTAEYKDMSPTAGHSKHANEAGGEWSHYATKTGQLDEAKVVAEAQKLALVHYPKKMETRTEGDRQVKYDANEDLRNEWIRKRVEGVKAEFYGGNKPQPGQQTSGEPAASQPSKPPVSFSHDDLTNMNRKVIQSDKYTDQQKQQYSNALMALQSLRIQYPNMEGATEEVKAEARRLALQIAAIPQ